MKKKFAIIAMWMLLFTPILFSAEDELAGMTPVEKRFDNAKKIMDYIKEISFGEGNNKFYVSNFIKEDRVEKQLNKILKRDSRKLFVKKHLSDIKDKRAHDIIKFIVGAFREDIEFSNGSRGIIRFDAHRGKRFAEPCITVEFFIDKVKDVKNSSYSTETGNDDNVDDNVENDDTENDEEESYIDTSNRKSVNIQVKGNSKKTEQNTSHGVKQIKKQTSNSEDAMDDENDNDNDTDEAFSYNEEQSSGNGNVTKSKKGVDEEEVENVVLLDPNSPNIVSEITEKICAVKFSNGIQLNLKDKNFKESLNAIISKLCKRKSRYKLIKLDTIDISAQDVPNVSRTKRGVFKINVPFTQDNKKSTGVLILRGISKNIFTGRKAAISYQFFTNDNVFDLENKNIVEVKVLKIMNYDRNNKADVRKISDMVYDNLLQSNRIIEAICSKNPGYKEKIIKKLQYLFKNKTYKSVKLPTLSRKSKLNHDDQGQLILTDDKLPIKKSKEGDSTIELAFTDLSDGTEKYVYLSFANGLSKTLKICAHRNKHFAKGN